MQRAKSRICAPVAFWNNADGCLVIPHKTTPESVSLREIQRKLDELTDTIFNAWWRDRFDARDGWLQQVIDEFHSIKPVDAPKTLQEVYEEYAPAQNLDSSTKRQYNVLFAALGRCFGKRVLYVDEITVRDIEVFVSFFRCERTRDGVINRSQNTISGKLKRWRALMNYSVSRGYTQSSPFSRYSIPAEVYGTPIFLTADERDALYAYDGLSPALRVQRDIFIFQCHVGCRVSDLLSFKKDNVTEDGFLQYIPKKQRRRVPMTVRVPLSDVALEIVNRYAKCAGDRLLPFISDVNYNVAIHDMMRLAGLDRKVMVLNPTTLQPEYKPLYEVTSSHTARKTFIEAMFRATKSERITSAFTGHADGSKAFSRYTDVDDDMKRDILARLNTPTN